MSCKKYFFPALLLLLAGCGKDDILNNQNTAITKYLDSKGTEYWQQEGVYKYIHNINRGGRSDLPIAGRGDQVSFWFAGYEFVSGPNNVPFYTNIKDAIKINNINFDPTFWSFEANLATLGTTPMFKGLERGLPGSCAGDSLYLFMTSDLAYGGKGMGLVPKNTAVMYFVYIDKVIKQQ
jgi:hypothetical protein